MNALSRSWQLTKLSFGVIAKDKELLLFPLISVLLSVMFLGALLYPTLWLELANDGSVEWDAANLIVTFISYLGLAFIGTFSNVCVVYTAKTRFEGGDATFGQSISFALSRIHQILGWAAVTASVGVVFKVLDDVAERAGGIGEVVVGILRGLLGLAWSVVTIFVVPSMVYRNTGPIDAIKDSVRVLRKTWGESLARSVGFGIAQFLVLLLGAAVFGGLFATVASTATISLALAVLAVVYFAGTIFVFKLAEMVFDTALYAYASEGKVVDGYTQQVLDGAVRTR